ncbi:hypothetical protein H2198_006564 [Neophaeococcomyces mojaviensis]|uniref:Uncharacterized protein n=1 Tax=Neophaeococcomyces mojaviensis TaxID=3383035 RepID=A0ACC3A2I7_9EURO|nr:hypothetical protein H2198_006564 [Knufia sp. JES_112]
MERCVSYLSDSRTIFVLDIPSSIEIANGRGRRLSSSPPPVEPYVTPEPKGKKREAFLKKLPPREIQYHETIQLAIKKALQSFHDHQNPVQWCFPRLLDSHAESAEQKATAVRHREQRPFPPVVLSSLPSHFNSLSEIQNVLVCHESQTPTDLFICDDTSFFIPQNSTFIWSSIESALQVLDDFTQKSRTGPKFDLILMDPPWSNRSVRKARTYSTMEVQEADPFEQALQLVDSYSNQHSYVAIWVTNKLAISQRVRASMQEREFVLAEEWIWTKVTTKGEPVTPLSGLWRKPYEVMFLFKHRSPFCIPSHRFIFAVPDLHSRKPNLKSMFDTLLGPQKVLELFARNLTSSWWSFGDEVLKYQDSKLWSNIEHT